VEKAIRTTHCEDKVVGRGIEPFPRRIQENGREKHTKKKRDKKHKKKWFSTAKEKKGSSKTVRLAGEETRGGKIGRKQSEMIEKE